ncbi:hypothetical protein GG681_09095 [Epibacterium sp. SM1969]|uniref:Uncharacterized protein n=1 Tax=Tritonibacter aquimaris TaxID=2663379 RepID=A0A844B070_9RHOB|nr:DUF6262 family protein [Tritonibacter aquimaris]MQY42796.1 hypothetical protein [Tritonibacter aquimaris]
MSKAKADDNIARLSAYLSEAGALPARGGKVSVTAIAKAAGIDRQVLYRNPRAKALLEDALRKKRLEGIEIQSVGERSENEKALERRVRRLEARNAVLASENMDLRARIRSLKHIEQMITMGKRVIP